MGALGLRHRVLGDSRLDVVLVSGGSNRGISPKLLREAGADLLARGHFDPFLPIDAMKVLFGEAVERDYDEQIAWEKALCKATGTKYGKGYRRA